MIVAGYYSFMLDIRVSIHPSASPTSGCLSFPDDNLSKHQWIFTKLSTNICALILWSSGLGLLIGKFHQILTELFARDKPIFLFPDDNLSKHQWIFTKLGMCINIVDIWFGIANG